MEQIEASYSSSMPKHVFGLTSSRGGPGFDRKAYAPFQAIIEKGKQAKAQDEHDQYEARKAKRDLDIKNAARIRHAEAEANRRRAEESKVSIDDHKGKLLYEMTKNIKAILENQYREEIRDKVYEDEDKIVSSYERDIKDQTKARLVRELEPVVKAKLGAEFEREVKQQLAEELALVVKAELRAACETEVKQQLVKELEPKVKAELYAKYETDVKQQLNEELRSGVEAELRAKYEEEIKNQLNIDPDPPFVHKLKGALTNDVQNEVQGQREALHTPGGDSVRIVPNDIGKKGGEYPDLGHQQHLINQNVMRNGQQEAGSIQDMEASDTDGDAVEVAHGTKRNLSDDDDDDEGSYARQSKRSRSALSRDEEQQSASGYEGGVSNLYSSYSDIQQPYQGVRYSGEQYQGFSPYKGDASYEDVQGINGHRIDRRASRYSSSDEVRGSHETILDREGADCNSAEAVSEMNGNFLNGEGPENDNAENVQGINGSLLNGEELGHDSDEVQGVNGSFLDRGGADYDSIEDIQGTNESYLHGEDAEYGSDEDVQGLNGNFVHGEGVDYDSAEDIKATNENALNREEADYNSAEDIEGSSGYKFDGEATDSYNSEEEEEEEEEEEYEYESEEEEQYATAPQAAPHSDARNGVITISNTQDTAFVLSDSEDDEDKANDEEKTLVGYDGPTVLKEAKHCSMPAEEALVLNA